MVKTNKLQQTTYTYKDTELIGIKDKDDVHWFYGKTICDILGYKKSNKAIIDHVTDVNRIKLGDLYTQLNVDITLTHNETISIWINEIGLDELSKKSRMDVAKSFNKWVNKTFKKEDSDIETEDENNDIIDVDNQSEISNENDIIEINKNRKINIIKNNETDIINLVFDAIEINGNKILL